VSRTPDRFPGTREDEGVVLEPGAVAPTVNGEIRYVTGSGFRFYEEGGEVGLSGSGLTPSQHEVVRQLIHFIDNGPAEGFVSGAYRENTGTVFPTAIIWYTDNTKVDKIVEKLITYTGAFATTIQWKMYDVDGSTVLATVTDTITYSGAFETSRTRTIA
jgi:hypothetical protein